VACNVELLQIGSLGQHDSNELKGIRYATSYLEIELRMRTMQLDATYDI
jgi:hypothetical protein